MAAPFIAKSNPTIAAKMPVPIAAPAQNDFNAIPPKKLVAIQQMIIRRTAFSPLFKCIDITLYDRVRVFDKVKRNFYP